MMSKPLLSALAATAPLLLAGLVHAQTCASNADCSAGLTCQVSSSTSAASAGPDCPADVDCSSPTEPPTLLLTCQPAPCTADADCATGMICYTSSSSVCTGTAPAPAKCDPATGCDTVAAPPEASCTTSTRSVCAYPWQLPCKADAECGDGFVCQPSVVGVCSGGTPVTTNPGSTGSGSTGSAGTSTGSAGSASSGSATGGASGSAGDGGSGIATPPVLVPDSGVTTPEPVCTTTTSFPGNCRAKVTTCATDADCPSVWKCVTIVQPGTISTQPQPVDAGAAEPASASDQPVTTNVCQSPFAAPTRGGSNEGGTGVTISVPSQTKGADAGTGGTGSTTPPSPTVPATDDSNTGTASGAKTGGGCSVAGSSSPSALWLGLVGLFALRSLRRKRTR